MLFQTERLLVRQLTEKDIDAMYAIYSDADAMRWVGDGEPITRDGCLKWIEVTRRNYATRGYGMSALTLRTTGSVVGFCGLVHPGCQPEVEIKYALLRDYWGQGFASEAAKGMLAYGAKILGMQEVIATTAPDNVASQRVLQKAGMQHVRTRPNDDGTFTKVFVWRPIQEDLTRENVR